MKSNYRSQRLARGRSLDCGGKRSATPLCERMRILTNANHSRPGESAVVAALCRRSPRRFRIRAGGLDSGFFVFIRGFNFCLS
jgi:hypothetical protein